MQGDIASLGRRSSDRLCGLMVIGVAVLFTVNVHGLDLSTIQSRLEAELKVQKPSPDVPPLDAVQEALVRELVNQKPGSVVLPAEVRVDIDRYKVYLSDVLQGRLSPRALAVYQQMTLGRIELPPLDALTRKDVEAYRQDLLRELYPDQAEPLAEDAADQQEPAAVEEPPSAAKIPQVSPAPAAVAPSNKTAPEDPAEARFRELESALQAQAQELSRRIVLFNAQQQVQAIKMQQVEQALAAEIRGTLENELALFRRVLNRETEGLARLEERLEDLASELAGEREGYQKRLDRKMERALQEFRESIYKDLSALREKDLRREQQSQASLQTFLESRDARSRDEIKAFKDAVVAELESYTSAQLDARLRQLDLLLEQMAETRAREAAAARDAVRRFNQDAPRDGREASIPEAQVLSADGL